MTAATTAVVQAKPRRGPWIAVIVLLLVVIAAMVTFLWFFVLPSDAGAQAGPTEGEIVALEPQTAALGGEPLRHARVGLAVVLADGHAPSVVDDRVALLQDALLDELSRMDGAELRSQEGTAALRAQLSADAQRIWGDDVALRVVLTELQIQ